MSQPSESKLFRLPTFKDLALVNADQTESFHPTADKQVAILAALLSNMGFLSSPEVQKQSVYTRDEWHNLTTVDLLHNFHADFPDQWLLSIYGDQASTQMGFKLKLISRDSREEKLRIKSDSKKNPDTATWPTAEIIKELLQRTRSPNSQFDESWKLPDPIIEPVTTFDLTLQLNRADFAHGVVVRDFQLVTGLQIHRGESVPFDPTLRHGTISLLTHHIAPTQ